MVLIRPASVSGMFYPNDLTELRNQLHGFYRDAMNIMNMDAAALDKIAAEKKDTALSSSADFPKVIIAPHAGYVYSGDCAARGFVQWYQHRDRIKRIISFGPSHRMFVDGVACPTSDVWQTPVGGVMIDQPSIKRLMNAQMDIVKCDDTPHALEHSIEVHVPFMQSLFQRFLLLPFVVGRVDVNKLTQLMEYLWGDEDTVFVISTDLSHYLSYDECNQLDSETAVKIEAMDWGALSGERACGFVPLGAMLKLAQTKNMTIERVHMCNSGDVAVGDKSRVVGYGAWKIY